jgi:hypothetical protein
MKFAKSFMLISFRKYALIIFAILYSFALNLIAKLSVFSVEYYIMFIPVILFCTYLLFKREYIKTDNSALDDSIMFFDDYKEIPKQYGQLPNELMLKKNQVLHLSVLVRDKVVASVYLSKWLTNKNLKPFGLELDSIQAHLPVNKTETSSKNNV